MHTDRGTLYYLIEMFQIKSMLDIGCGPGDMVRIAKHRGLDAIGIDGDFTLKFKDSKVLIHDFCTGPADLGDSKFDLAWSVEFLEHVDEKYVDNYMRAFARCKYAIVTAAPPGHGSHHHVNEQPKEYWIKTFAKYGFTFSETFTKEIRENRSNMRKPFMQKNGLFFINTENNGR